MIIFLDFDGVLHNIGCAQGREHAHWIAVDDCPDNFGPDLPGAGTMLFTDSSAGFDQPAQTASEELI